jgi:hypothetical protein
VAALIFKKDCGQFRVGAEAALKLAREINGYHIAIDTREYAANRAGAMELLDNDRAVLMWSPDLARDCAEVSNS